MNAQCLWSAISKTTLRYPSHSERHKELVSTPRSSMGPGLSCHSVEQVVSFAHQQVQHHIGTNFWPLTSCARVGMKITYMWHVGLSIPRQTVLHHSQIGLISPQLCVPLTPSISMNDRIRSSPQLVLRVSRPLRMRFDLQQHSQVSRTCSLASWQTSRDSKFP